MNKLIGIIIAFVFPLVFFFATDFSDPFKIIGKKNFPSVNRLIEVDAKDERTNKKLIGDKWFHTVPDFAFDGHTGDKVSLAQYEDKVFVADFFFTHCPGICPKMSSQLQRVQYEFRDEQQLMILSHTVDPERDTVEQLNSYADQYEVDSTRWLMVTGNKKALYDQARYGYFVSATEGDGGPEDFIHTEKFILVDKDRIIRGYYDGTDPEDVNKMMVDIKTLLLEYK